MARDFEYYLDNANNMIDADTRRDKAFAAYHAIYHCDWNLPDEIREVQWIRKYVDTGGHDAVNAGDRTLSSLQPIIRKYPYGSDMQNKRIANDDERNLRWQLMALDQRRSRGVVSELIRSALMYDAIAMNVIDLEWQIKVNKEKGIETKLLKLARQQSRFLANVFCPLDVHARYSTYGTDTILLCQERMAFEVASEWPNVYDELEELIKANESVLYYDYMDIENRAIWVGPSSGGGKIATSDLYARILDPMEHGLDFLPWIAMVGGTQLEGDESRKYHPLLYALHFAGTWETQNVVKTLRNSEVIAHAAAPRISDEGTNPEYPDFNYFSPERIAKPAVGNTLRPLPPPQIDAALNEIGDRLDGDAQRSTVSRILQGGNVPSGTAFSALNLATQTAVGSLKPAKLLVEKSLVQMFRTMLLWTKFTDIPLMAFGINPKADDYGNQYVIQPDEIDPSAIYLEVELTPDVPTDRLQRANAASIMTQYGYPREYALEDLGIQDPQTALKTWHMERYVDHLFNMRMQSEMSQMQMAMQQQAQQAMQAQQAEMQQEQAAQQQAAQQQVQGPIPGGQGFNPAMGGTPPIQATAGAGAREAVTGRTLTGEELA